MMPCSRCVIDSISGAYSNREVRKLIATIALVAATATPHSALASEITAERSEDGSLTLIFIQGEIEAGDERKFRKLALEHSDAIVVLDSPGGAVGPALEIGRAINVSSFPTVVFGDSYCTSACALIWLAGSVRGLSRDAKLGFHASYRDESGVALESGAANALVGQYLTQLGLPAKAILFATLAPPNDFLWLDESTAERSGISFRLLDGEGSSDSRVADAEVTVPAPPPQAAPPQSEFEARITKFPKDWVVRRASRHGLDVTPDGRMWFNADEYGDTVDYGVSADDLWSATGRFRKAWVRGYHKRDTSVPYRESLQLIHADCATQKWGSEMVVHFDADGKMLDQSSGPWEWEPVVPRTYAETWHSMICAD
jgi:hypothetical protein